MSGAAMVTGASSGIGLAYAEALAARGHPLVLVARREDRLHTLARSLAARHGVEAEVLVADLTEPAGLGRAARRAEASLALLVNNAGFGATGPLAALDRDALSRLVDVHVHATARLTHAAVPAMLAAGAGAIVNVASGLAFAGTPPRDERKRRRVNAVYAGAKAFVVTFTRAVAAELEGTGVSAQALCPSVTATEFFGATPPPGAMRPEDVAAASLEGLRRGEVLCMPGLEDGGLVDRLAEVERALLEGNAGAAPATRYRAEALR